MRDRYLTECRAGKVFSAYGLKCAPKAIPGKRRGTIAMARHTRRCAARSLSGIDCPDAADVRRVGHAPRGTLPAFGIAPIDMDTLPNTARTRPNTAHGRQFKN